MNEIIKIVEPAFCVALYEMEKKINEGYKLTQNVPIFIGGLYEIELEKVESGMDQLNKILEAVSVSTEDTLSEKQEEKTIEAPKRGRRPLNKH